MMPHTEAGMFSGKAMPPVGGFQGEARRRRRQNDPADRFERRTPRAWASGKARPATFRDILGSKHRGNRSGQCQCPFQAGRGALGRAAVCFGFPARLARRIGRLLRIKKFDPDRRVVAALLPPAHGFIDLGAFQSFGEIGCEQQMVDPQSRIAGIGVPEIIPEGIDAFVRMQGSQRIGPALPAAAAATRRRSSDDAWGLPGGLVPVIGAAHACEHNFCCFQSTTIIVNNIHNVCCIVIPMET
jgi:hypothetical protein